jgi:hypothetical protein
MGLLAAFAGSVPALAGNLGFKIDLRPSAGTVRSGDLFTVDVWAMVDTGNYCTADPGSGSCLLGSYNVGIQFDSKAYTLADNPIRYSSALGPNAEQAGTYYGASRLSLSQSAVDVSETLQQGTGFKLATLSFYAAQMVSGSSIQVVSAYGSERYTGSMAMWNFAAAKILPFGAAAPPAPPQLPPPVIAIPPPPVNAPSAPVGVTGTPEPSTIGMGLIGLAAIAWLHRRRSARG